MEYIGDSIIINLNFQFSPCLEIVLPNNCRSLNLNHPSLMQYIVLPWNYIRTGIICKKISCCMLDSTCRWCIVKKAKISWCYVKVVRVVNKKLTFTDWFFWWFDNKNLAMQNLIPINFWQSFINSEKPGYLSAKACSRFFYFV